MRRRSSETARNAGQGAASGSPRSSFDRAGSGRIGLVAVAVVALVALVAAACVKPTAAPAGPMTDTGRPLPAAGSPNIVLVLADDLDATTTPFWDAMPRTKELIADQGLTFSDTVSTTPICCAARSSILTGKLGHNTGVLTNSGPNGGWETFVGNGNEEQTIAVALEAAGYRTALMGKYLNGIEDDPTHIPPGWTEWYGGVDHALYSGYGYTLNENGTLVKYGYAAKDYSTDMLAAKGKDFIKRSNTINDDRPFFMYMSPTAPHLPLGPPPRYSGNQFSDDLAPRRANYAEADISDKPTWLQASGATRMNAMGWVDTDYRNRMGSLMALDDMVVGLIDELRNTGELDNTVIVFAADNGYNNGAHRLIHKMAPYEESLLVPLSIVGPGIAHGTTDATVTLADLAPTFAELGGATIPGVVDGRSLVPMLSTATPPADWGHEVITQYASDGNSFGIIEEIPPELYYYFFVELTAQEIPAYTSLRNDHWKVIRWDAVTNGTTVDEWELYDLDADPYEMNNLLATAEGRAANEAVFDELSARMIELSTCAGATCP